MTRTDEKTLRRGVRAIEREIKRLIGEAAGDGARIGLYANRVSEDLARHTAAHPQNVDVVENDNKVTLDFEECPMPEAKKVVFNTTTLSIKITLENGKSFVMRYDDEQPAVVSAMESLWTNLYALLQTRYHRPSVDLQTIYDVQQALRRF